MKKLVYLYFFANFAARYYKLTITKMKRSIISLFLILLSALQVSAYKKQSIDINVNGQKRNMVVYTPNKMLDKMPLFIVAWHEPRPGIPIWF